MVQAIHPTWEDNIKLLFSGPYWIEEKQRQGIVREWHGCMKGYDVILDDYASVKQWSVTIYNHLHSRNMPLTTDPSQFWPDEALELFRLWVNEGWRQKANDPVQEETRIPLPRSRPEPLRIRKDILDLSQGELDDYRMRLDDLDISEALPSSAWQQLAYIHTNWCLHYQEAFLLWHRAFLLYFEQMIGIPIPYWNWTSPDAPKDDSPNGGMPEAFKDLTYVHPRTGEERPNPLRFAAAKDGKSKACFMQNWPINQDECKYVQRDPVLYTEGENHRKERENKLAELRLYQRQIVNALLWPIFSTPEEYPGYPWANIPSFDPPPPDSNYPHRCDFDGLFEQPHDNFHGWAGPDMADNAFTAFDPIFWAHHSNLDRILETWKREHQSAVYTSNFSIRPFVGPLANEVDFADPRDFIYTTIGDMVKDSRSLGYDYAIPKGDELSRTDYEEWPNHLYIIFKGVRCTQESYFLDVFINQPNPQSSHAKLSNQNYVGRITRLGMGVEDENGRCIRQGVARVIDATYTANALNLDTESEITLSMIVTDVTRQEILSLEQYEKLPGFVPITQWGTAMPPSLQGNVSSNDGETCHV